MRVIAIHVILILLAGCEQSAVSGPNQSGLASGNRLSLQCELGLNGFQQANGYPVAIRLLQQKAQLKLDAHQLENLAWAYVSYSRDQQSPEHLYLAGNVAKCMQQQAGDSAQTMLLQAHVLQQQHQFAEAESIAASLVSKRGGWFDHAVYGDALLERGKLDLAAQSYQHMVDLKPGAEAYGRIGHLRWLRGDVPGAIELLTMAARASNPQDIGGSVFWHSRLAYLLWLNSQRNEALAILDHVDRINNGYLPAQFLRGRIYLSEGSVSRAVTLFEAVVSEAAEPEYLWGLWEAYTAARQSVLAQATQQRLVNEDGHKDRRTLSLFLAHHDINHAQASQLAQAELQTRQDALTLDALALSQFKLGQIDQAETSISRALDSGAVEPRLFLHAAQIANRQIEQQKTERWIARARQYRHLLWPSEIQQLDRLGLSAGSRVPGLASQTRSESNT